MFFVVVVILALLCDVHSVVFTTQFYGKNEVKTQEDVAFFFGSSSKSCLTKYHNIDVIIVTHDNDD